MEQPDELGLIIKVVRLEAQYERDREYMRQELERLSARLMQAEAAQLPPSSHSDRVSMETWAKIICALLLPPFVLLLTGSLDMALRAARLTAL